MIAGAVTTQPRTLEVFPQSFPPGDAVSAFSCKDGLDKPLEAAFLPSTDWFLAMSFPKKFKSLEIHQTFTKENDPTFKEENTFIIKPSQEGESREGTLGNDTQTYSEKVTSNPWTKELQITGKTAPKGSENAPDNISLVMSAGFASMETRGQVNGLTLQESFGSDPYSGSFTASGNIGGVPFRQQMIFSGPGALNLAGLFGGLVDTGVLTGTPSGYHISRKTGTLILEEDIRVTP
ncbi:MAG: hypothetical protein HYU64_13345 [Armatimonadetes bacterium]|nr:hypothetical protein [Armatimonadota bacterium]